MSQHDQPAGGAHDRVPPAEALFARYARFIVRHRFAVLCAVVAVTAALASQLPKLHLEISRRANLPGAHPYVQIQNRISDLFGGEAVVIIGVIAEPGAVLSQPVLDKVRRITDRLRASPHLIEPSLFSLAAPNVRAISAGDEGEVRIDPVLDEGAVTPEAIAALRARLQADPLIEALLVSADEHATLITADFDDRITDAELMQVIEAAVAPERDGTVTIALAGAPVLRSALARYTAMMRWLFPLAVLVIGLVHYEAFRTLQAMVLPLATALLSVVWALGIMGAVGLAMDTWSAMTPVLILAIAAGHAVQILKRYYEEYAARGDNDAAVIASLAAVGPVMLTAGGIAAAGFASLMTFGITSVRAFGALLAGGIVSALIIELTFTPACRSLLPAPRRGELVRERRPGVLDRLLARMADLAIGRPRAVLAGTAVVTLIAAIGILDLHVDNSFRLWFASDTTVRRDDALLNEALPGTATLRVLISGDRDGALLEPAVLRAMADLQAEMARVPEIAGVTSIADHVRRTHRALHGGDGTGADAWPTDPALVGEYLFLYEAASGPGGLSAFIDADHRNAVIRALSKTDSAAFSRDLLARLQQYAETRFAGLPARAEIAGGTLGVQTAMNDIIVTEKLHNLLQIAVIIFVLCWLVFRSATAALLVMLPLAVAAIVNLGLMGYAGIWLDMSTAAIAAMGVSIGADFAIYLMFRVREERRRGQSLDMALRRSLLTAGKATFYVTSAVVAGYLVLPLSGFSIWIRLGVATATIVCTSGLTALLVIPACAVLFEPKTLARIEPRPQPQSLSSDADAALPAS